MTPRKRPEDKLRPGRPTAFTKETLDKLDSIFLIGGSDKEACLYAGISVDALYAHQRRNPEYLKRKDLMKETPFLKARNTVVRAISEPDTAKWYLERKGKDEFATRSAVAYSNRIEVDESITKIIEVVQAEVPENCPHCKMSLNSRGNIAEKLKQLSSDKDDEQTEG